MQIRLVLTASGLLLGVVGCGRDAGTPSEPTPTLGGAVSASAALTFWQLDAGQEHTCGVTTDNQAYCWGWNGYAQLGDGTGVNRPVPGAVLGGIQFRTLAAGDFRHTCGVATDNRAWCWGNNDFGQLGDGTPTDRTRPTLVAGGHQFRQLSGGYDFTCGLTTDNRAWCWGQNTYGALGDGTTTDRRRPVAVLGGLRFRQIAAGYGHACAVTTDDRAYCWGINRQGRLGDSTRITRTRPAAVAGGRHFRQIAAGGMHTCAVGTDGRAYCWGANGHAQLGNGKIPDSEAGAPGVIWPKPVRSGLLFRRVIAGGYHTCGEGTNGHTYCWGDNGYGQLGDGTQELRATPRLVGGGLMFKQVTTGLYHTCAKTGTSTGYCWGNNWSGQLGDGSVDHRFTPTPIAGAM